MVKKVKVWKKLIDGLKVIPTKILKKLSGKKSYLIGCLAVIIGVAGFLTGEVDQNNSMIMVTLGLGLLGLRNGIKKAEFEE